jgi:hypothetical protein
VPPAIEFVPFGDEIGRGLSFDTLAIAAKKRGFLPNFIEAWIVDIFT